MNKPFDPTKPVQTRDGRKARIICTDRKSPSFPIIALIEAGSGREQFDSFSSEGKLGTGQCDMDLINISEEPKWRAWKPEEVPVGAQIRFKKDAEKHKCRSLILSSEDGLIHYYDGDYTAESALAQAEYSSDGGRTWNPCGIKE